MRVDSLFQRRNFPTTLENFRFKSGVTGCSRLPHVQPCAIPRSLCAAYLPIARTWVVFREGTRLASPTHVRFLARGANNFALIKALQCQDPSLHPRLRPHTDPMPVMAQLAPSKPPRRFYRASVWLSKPSAIAPTCSASRRLRPTRETKGQSVSRLFAFLF